MLYCGLGQMIHYPVLGQQRSHLYSIRLRPSGPLLTESDPIADTIAARSLPGEAQWGAAGSGPVGRRFDSCLQVNFMTDDSEHTLRVSPAYAYNQLLRALSSGAETADAKAAQWRRVLAGMFDGALRPGSRIPVADTPAWVTLEVVHGGFATGAFVVGGPLEPHERELLQRIDRPPGVTERAALNAYFLGTVGRTELLDRLRSGHYRVGAPEEAALLVMSWLLDQGETARAEGLLEEIAPFFDRLRFYPAPADRPLPSGEGVFVQSAAEVVAKLRARRPKHAIVAMQEAIQIWTPLYDRAVMLLLETVEGETPHLATTALGELERRPDGHPRINGGWPCRTFPDEWANRARALLQEYEQQRTTHQLCGKPEKRKENFTRLRGYLARLIEDPAQLTGRDVGMMRKILASYVTCHGAPGSERLAATRETQARNAARPTHVQYAQLLADRIAERGATHDPEEGLPDVDTCLVPLTAEEAAAFGVSVGRPIPPSLRWKAVRCLQAPLETLIRRHIVRSSEGIALLLPQLTAQIRASAIAVPELRPLYAAVYRAFRRRRSLLLINLASQVRLQELPWMDALTPWIGASDASRQSAHQALTQATQVAVTSFPYTLLPNRLVRELRALVTVAELQIPLVDELAADIFMGTFSSAFVRAAQVAAPALAGTLYERYYGLPLQQVVTLDDFVERPSGAATSPSFDALCAELAGVEDGGRWSVAANGTIIEQCQILTTHNLAPLLSRLDLIEELLDQFPLLAQQCFAWICARLQLGIKEWRAGLHNVKNAAYAWRQMLLYLSFAEAEETPRFLQWSDAHLEQQAQEFRQQFALVQNGLRAVAMGQQFSAAGRTPAGEGRRFLGWTVGRHWLFAEPGETSES
jgi:hypothetical protein